MSLHTYLLSSVPTWLWGSLMVFLFVLTQLSLNYIVDAFYKTNYLAQYNEITVNIFQAIATVAAILFGFLAFFVLNNLQTAIDETVQEVSEVSKVFRELTLVPDKKAVQPAQRDLYKYLLNLIDNEIPTQKQGVVHNVSYQYHGWNILESFTREVLRAPILDVYKDNIIDDLQDLYAARRNRINNDDLVLPTIVWVVTFWSILIMMINVAFIGCKESHYRQLYSALFAASIGLVIMLIYELDLPFLGAVSVNDQAHRDLAKNIYIRLGHDYLYGKQG
jgi:hypothetical protein